MDLERINKLVIRNYPMAQVTSLGVGGPADFFFRPSNVTEVQMGLQYAEKHSLPLTILGYGTNVLVTDKGIRGFVMQIADNLATAEVNGSLITATAGCLYGSVSKLAAFHSLSGLEFAVGIPGSIGGAIYMNAGAYGGETGPLVKEVSWVTADSIGHWGKGEYWYSYRNSRVQEEHVVVTKVTLELIPGNQEEIYEKMADFTSQRWAKQPLEYPSAGSTFKRPPGYYVGPMIEQANLKGFRIGGAQVSTKHAGFIINTGGATAQDFLDLIQYIQVKIKEQFGVALEPEVRIIGER